MPRDDHYYYCQWHVCMCGMSVTLLPPDPLCAALSTGFTSAAIICCATHAAHASQIGTFGTPTSMPYNPLLSKAYAGVHSPARVRDCSAFFTPTQSRISQNEYHTVLRTGYPILQHYSAYRSSRPAASFEAEFRCLFGGIRRCRSVYPVNSSLGTRSPSFPHCVAISRIVCATPALAFSLPMRERRSATTDNHLRSPCPTSVAAHKTGTWLRPGPGPGRTGEEGGKEGGQPTASGGRRPIYKIQMGTTHTTPTPPSYPGETKMGGGRGTNICSSVVCLLAPAPGGTMFRE